MKRYRLLRDNKEFGPFVLGELKSFGVYHSDLVWVEEESSSWNYTSDIPELKAMVQKRPEKQVHKPQVIGQDPNVHPVWKTENSPAPMVAETTAEEYFSMTKERIAFKAKPKTFDMAAVTANLFGLGVLLVGVMLGAFVVKKIVDHFEFEPMVASANAVEITNEVLPVSTGNYAAKSTSSVAAGMMNESIVETPVDTTRLKTVQTKKKQSISLQVNTNTAPAEQAKADLSPDININQENEETKQVTDNQKAGKLEEAVAEKKAPSLKLSANDYKVGVFGGISDLEITVNNPSADNVAKAIVQVEFLKSNGNVVKTQTLSVENISPGGTKKINVPASNRGVTVRYRIVGVDD